MEERRCLGCMRLTSAGEQCEYCGFTIGQSNESHQLQPGTELHGKYIVGRVLGQGGFGITYLGWDKYLEMPVAIKEFYPSTLVTRDAVSDTQVYCSMEFNLKSYQSGRERFLREAKALTKFSYVPQIVQMKDFFEENSTAYIIMEYIKGRDLRSYVELRGGRLTMKEVMAILGPVMEALTIVHEDGLIHRDISPDNLMLDPLGGAKLLDFGAVRNVDSPDAEKELTRSTEAILKHGFAPPEQYRNRGSLGPWTDVYALCATIYYCLTGKVPLDALARMMGEGEIDYDALSVLPDYQVYALKKGMELKAKDRFASVKQLHEALTTAREIPAEQKALRREEQEEPKEPEKEEKTPKRGKGWIWPLAAMLALAVGLAAYWGFRDGGIPVSLRQPAVTEPEDSTASSPQTEPSVEPETPADSLPQPAQQTDPPAPEPENNAPEQTWGEEDQIYEQDAGPWLNNVMCSNLFGTMVISKDTVKTVVFHDTLERVPESSWDVSDARDGSVRAWVDGEGIIHIAGEGGINGAIACEKMFEGCRFLRSVTFGEGFHMELAASTRGMFEGCMELRTVDAANLKMSNVTNASRMFYDCVALQSLDADSWDVSSVTNMSLMFHNCSILSDLDVSRWDTSSARDMSGMFSGCGAFQRLDLSGWDTGNVTDMSEMFSDCAGLKTLEAAQWDISSVTDLRAMFFNCIELSELNVADWNTSRVTSLERTFCECRSLVELDVSRWRTNRVTNMYKTFAGCYNLSEIGVGNWDVSKVTEYTWFMDSNQTVNGKPWRKLFED